MVVGRLGWRGGGRRLELCTVILLHVEAIGLLTPDAEMKPHRDITTVDLDLTCSCGRGTRGYV
jgi:hypothetical protein